jgi:hypothetical protein
VLPIFNAYGIRKLRTAGGWFGVWFLLNTYGIGIGEHLPQYLIEKNYGIMEILPKSQQVWVGRWFGCFVVLIVLPIFNAYGIGRSSAEVVVWVVYLFYPYLMPTA